MKKISNVILIILATLLILSGYTYSTNDNTPNVHASDFTLTSGSGATFESVENGIKISTDKRQSRVSYTKFNPIDGMEIILTDINIPQPINNGDWSYLRFNIGHKPGHFYYTGATGVLIEIRTGKVNDELISGVHARHAEDSRNEVYIDFNDETSKINVFPNNNHPNEIVIKFNIVGDNMEMSINDQVFTTPKENFLNNIKDFKDATVVFGGHSNVDGVEKGVTYVINTIGKPSVLPTINDIPITPTKRISNTLQGHFYDTYTTGSIMETVADGIKLSFSEISHRTTYNQSNKLDGLEIDILDFDSNTNDSGIIITLTSNMGHYLGSGTIGLYIRIYNVYISGEKHLYMMVKKADKNDNDSEFLLLEPTYLKGFENGIPELLRLKFEIKTNHLSIKLNEVEVLIDKDKSLEYMNTNTPLITFGSSRVFSNTDVSYVVGFVGESDETTINGNDREIVETIKVLSIGNSFSVDAFAFLYDIGRANGIEIIFGIAHIGGGTLEEHANSLDNEDKIYTYYLTNHPIISKDKLNLREILEDQDWDFITFQQGSHYSGMWETYIPYLEDLKNYVVNIKPEVELLIHQTWAYEYNSNHSGFPNYNNSQEQMHNQIVSSYQNASDLINASKIIPSGDAFKIARKNNVFNPEEGGLPLTRDGYHASYLHGRYLIAATWFEALTNLSILENDLTVRGISNDELLVLKNAAHEAVVTDSNDEEKVNVIFNFNYEDSPNDINVSLNKDEKVDEPSNPTREGYEFMGWYLEENLFNFNDKVTGDITLIAKWQKIVEKNDLIVVTFDYNYDDIIPVEVLIEKNKTVLEPVSPSREGYEFNGWFLNDIEFNFDSNISENITLIANWTLVDNSNEAQEKSPIYLYVGLATAVSLIGVLGAVLLIRKRKLR
ncbi:MAG: DUF4886 domain-containing protein [Acholeplasmataceae bacterium]